MRENIDAKDYDVVNVTNDKKMSTELNKRFFIISNLKASHAISRKNLPLFKNSHI